MVKPDDLHLGLGFRTSRGGFRWQRRAGELRLSIPVKPTWKPVLIWGAISLVAAVAYPLLYQLIPRGRPFDWLAYVAGVAMIYAGMFGLFAFAETAYAQWWPWWVPRSSNPAALTIGKGELVAEWLDGRTRIIPREAVVDVTAADHSPGDAEVAWWYVTVSVADGPPILLDVGASHGVAKWLADTLTRALDLPATTVRNDAKEAICS